jgi:hypothetical protein
VTAAEAWRSDWLEEADPAGPLGSGTQVLDKTSKRRAARLGEPVERRRRQEAGWNVLVETLVEFPRPSCRPFLDESATAGSGDRAHASPPSYGQAWLEKELTDLRSRTHPARIGQSPTSLEIAQPAHSVKKRAPRAQRQAAPYAGSPRGNALRHQLGFDDEPAAELEAALDAFFAPPAACRRASVSAGISSRRVGASREWTSLAASPLPAMAGATESIRLSPTGLQRLARVAEAAAPTRTRVAQARPRGLRRLLPGVATLAVLAALFAGAQELNSLRARPPVVLQGSVEVHPGEYAYVARPGDTLWSIASRVEPSGDPRPLVADLETQLHGATLQPGDRLLLP